MIDDSPLAGKVALVAGATRGAGRAIAVELARAGPFVYATGRSSRTAGRSELGRPETIEETGELISAAGGSGAACVVDHEDPDAVTELVATVELEHGRLDVLVNDIFGGDRYMQWDKPLWEHDWQAGLRMLQMGVHTHLRRHGTRPGERCRAMGWHDHLRPPARRRLPNYRRWLPTAGNATTALASTTSASPYCASRRS